MKSVFKYPLRCTSAPEVQEVLMPKGAELLSVATADVGGNVRQLFLWAKINTQSPDGQSVNYSEVRQIVVLGTGQAFFEYKGDLRFIGSVSYEADWSCQIAHVFEVVNPQ